MFLQMIISDKKFLYNYICYVTLGFILNVSADYMEPTQCDNGIEKIYEDDCNLRLPHDVIPEHYDVTLYPDLNAGVFHGSTSITLTISKEKKLIILHSSGLNMSEVKFMNCETYEEFPISCQYYNKKYENYAIQLVNYATPGCYIFSMNFTGSLPDGKVIGLYKSSYKDPAGNLRQIATSKFEPTYARQAFPCFDEPGFKATFTVKLVRPSANKYIALSNMNQVAEYPNQPSAGLTTVEFAKSVPMSTYLVCFIVCDFDNLQPLQSQQGFPVSVYARPGQANNMQHALEFAVKTINYYIDYFGIKYPLPKLDLIAIPDFVSGAMEHWGLVTFRETQVLFNEVNNSLVNKKHVSLTIAHELAHMWFGNLVTMEWWNDLWLNEGFASFMEYKGVAHSYPEWDMDTQMLIDDAQRVLPLDCALSSHPIVQTVSHPDQITEIFDTITYSKGPTIIRMLEDMIGPKVFQDGVSEYLNHFAYHNAQTEDLWKALEQKSGGMNVSEIMSTWTNQMGYPLVDVRRSSADKITLTQYRFLANSNITFNENDSPFHYKWHIPLTYITSANPTEVHRSWFSVHHPSVDITLPLGTNWFKLNYRQFGYYRVRYPPEDWQKLVNMLQQYPESISAADRANLLDDAFSLAKAGYSSYKMALDAIQYLPKEKHFVPMIVAAHKLQSLQNILSSTRAYVKFRKYVHRLLEPVVTDSLWEMSATDSYLERRRKIVTLELGCSLRVPSCVARAEDIFKSWLYRNGPKPEPELRNLVYMIGMYHSREEEWDKLWQLYLAEQEPQEKAKLRNALTAVREPWLLNRYIDLAKDENNVRSQDFLVLLTTIAENPVGTPIIWDYVRDQWQYLVKRFTLNNRALGTLIPRITSTFNTRTKLEELKAFLHANPESGAGATGRKNALEKIENNIQWIDAHLPELLSIF